MSNCLGCHIAFVFGANGQKPLRWPKMATAEKTTILMRMNWWLSWWEWWPQWQCRPDKATVAAHQGIPTRSSGWPVPSSWRSSWSSLTSWFSLWSIIEYRKLSASPAHSSVWPMMSWSSWRSWWSSQSTMATITMIMIIAIVPITSIASSSSLPSWWVWRVWNNFHWLQALALSHHALGQKAFVGCWWWKWWRLYRWLWWRWQWWWLRWCWVYPTTPSARGPL